MSRHIRMSLHLTAHYHSMDVRVTSALNDTDITLQTVQTYSSLSLCLSQPSRNANVYVCL